MFENRNTLLLLTEGKWAETQRNLYANLRRTPCHETINNLGFFLATEGKITRQGKSRSAINCGLLYLSLARCLKKTLKNTAAIANVLILKERKYSIKFYKRIYSLLEGAEDEKISYSLRYNLLASCFVSGSPVDVDKFWECFQKKQSSESLFLLLCVLATHEDKDTCISLLERYSSLIDIYDQVSLYYICGRIDAVILKVPELLDNYLLDEDITYIIFDSYLQRNLRDDALLFVKYVLSQYVQNEIRIKPFKFRSFLYHPSRHLKTVYSHIKHFRLKPSLISMCGYFDCPVHTEI